MSTSTPRPAYAAPAADGAVAYYGDPKGRRFLMTAKAGHTPRLGEEFDCWGPCIVAGFTDGLSGLTWANFGQRAPVEVDGLPVAAALPVRTVVRAQKVAA